MKKIITLFAICAYVSTILSPLEVFAQKETFDITTYTPPKAWKKQPTESAVQFKKEDAAKGTYGIITLYKAVPGTANSKENFDLAWASLVKEMVTISVAPEMQPAATENGWEAQSGYAPFESDGKKGIVILATSSSFKKMVNIIILTNTDVYEKDISGFLESVSLKKPDRDLQTGPGNNSDNASVMGTWLKSGSVNPAWADIVATNNAGYTTDQYTFNKNGTYAFYSKTFRYTFDKLLLVKESGTYQITGKNLIVMPQKSVIEAWSKKDGTDKWGKLLSTQKRPIEKITYHFTRHYFSGIDEWNLVLQSDKPTQRDGKFSGNTTFTNAYYYTQPASNHIVIELPGGQQAATQKDEPIQQTAGTGFAFTTTNFDDGWTSTVQEDWVQVTKANIKVLIHYPNKKADAYNSVVMDGLKNAWNILVAPRYSAASNFEFKPITGWQTIEFAEADMVEKLTGKSVHVVLFKMNYSNGSGKYLEFITANKNSFELEFGAYHQTTSGWEKMESMANYNKFAVAASDLQGKWTSDFSGAIQYVNAYTGFDAGMDTHASNENFNIGAGNAYNWDLGVASGQVGNIKFQSKKSSGKLTMTGNWKVNFSDIEGRPRSYDVHFSCIKGLRILWLDNRPFAKVE